MENCKTSKFENYNGVNNMVSNQAVVKSQLSIQRCYSDGVLTNGHVSSEGKVLSAAGKSSSESSMNGSPVSTPTKLDSRRRAATEIDCEISSSQSSDECNSDNQLISSSVDSKSFITANGPITNGGVVRPKIWKCRIADKKCDGEKARRRNGDIELQMNGLEITNGISIHQRRYSQDGCDLYENENDLFVSRLRGGVRRDLNANGHGITNQHENSLITRFGSGQESTSQRQQDSPSMEEVCNGSNSTCNEISSDIQCLIAPLAIPENLSDEESPSRESCQTQKETLECIYDGNSHSESTCSENDPSTLSVGCSNVLMPTCLQSVSRLLPSNRSSSSSHKENNTNGAECLECLEPRIQNSNSETELNTERERVQIDAELCNLGQENMVQARASVVSSTDSLDDIGDFIEADLPPNVDRLAFFSRGSSQSSSTEEDEGCGDEVFPSNLDGVDSENETIDPLVSNASARYPLQSNQNRVQLDNGVLSMNRGYNVTPGLGGIENGSDSNNILSCVVQHRCNSCACGGTGVRPHSSRLNTDTLHCWSSIINEDKNDGKVCNKGDNTCVCCDKLIDVNIQRRDEIGVNVCDKCFNEHNFERNGTFENAVKNRSKPTGAFSLNTQFPKRNCNSLQVAKNMQEKVNNNSLSSFRLSSSDSDPLDKLYVSDSSEVVSPEGDAGAELVFHPGGANITEGAACSLVDKSNVTDGANIADVGETSGSNITDRSNVQSEERTDATAHGEEGGGLIPNLPVCRQSVSLEFNTAEEDLYCPYFNRRSRSLDQDSADNVSHSRSPECDVPNIAVATSNFQDDESNNQEKLFEKQAYEVDHVACSSSDEEENTRVPIVASDIGDFMPEPQSAIHLQESVSFTFPRSSLERYKRRNKSLGLEEEEPIYEDIDDLELLLEEVCSEGEPDNRTPTQPLCSAISKLRRKRRHRSPISDVEKVMIWNEYEAYVVQVKQIGTSACGPTAVLNVLKAFDYQVEKEEVATTITSNLRMEAAPIPYYLFSRYSAGTTAQNLVEGVATVTRGAIKGRFFHFYPPRELELMKWLGYWMKKGAVPVATLNLQKGVKKGWTIPDAWHHQMVYGVSSKGVYLTNPLEIVPENIILEQLMSDSVLLVRRQDVVSRFRDWCPLNEILKQRDPRWRTMNVLGQIVHMLREHCMPQEQLAGMRSQLTSHICIPAAYKAGIILFMKAKSEAYEELLQAPELPLKNTQQSSQSQ